MVGVQASSFSAGGSLGQGEFCAGKWRTCPVVTIAKGHKVIGACRVFPLPLQKHRSCCLSLFPGLELLLCSDAKAWHWEVLCPS